MSLPVAIIDIGSNSIKILLADRDLSGNVRSLGTRTVDARISAGINRATPRLTDESMQRGVAALRALLAFAAPYAPTKTILVATSAVRDAENGGDFRSLVRSEIGHEIRILTGDEEANLIGRGLTCDPELSALRNFYVFDLGGGSLECLAFRDRQIERAVSLQLGCVRLTEKFIVDPTLPIAPSVSAALTAHVHSCLTARFPFSLPPDAVAVGCGGTVTTVRAILATRAGCALELISAEVDVAHLQALLAEVAALPLGERQRIPGLPAARADVFPAALATLIALADAGGFRAYRHSFYNLRFGLAAEILGNA